MSDYSRFEIKFIFALLKAKRSFSCFFFDGKYFDSVQKRINSLRFLFEGSFYVRRINEKNLFLAEHFFFHFSCRGHRHDGVNDAALSLL